MEQAKRKIGSKIILKMAPDRRTPLENLGLPSARIKWAMAMEKMAKGSPILMIRAYGTA